MPRMIFVNLPVADLKRSMAFYEAVGATNEPKFTNEAAAMMRFSDEVHVMLLTHDFYRTFTSKQIPDARVSAQVLLCLSSESREAVDAQIEAARQAGGVIDPTPAQDHGMMYGRSYEDPDGHIWEIMWMDAAAAEAGAAAIDTDATQPTA
ncbi:MAG TPA: VOC family protein [Allosphingosinicella sp.]|nr:VOC family protein [Allosphingosinicella sp.]